MLAWMLRGVLFAQVLALAALFGLLLGLGWLESLVASAFAFLALQALPLGAAYRVSRRFASPEPPGGGPPTFASVMQEYLAFMALFSVVQPLERLFMGSDAIGRLPAGQHPVLLVHGYLCNRGYWWWFRRALRSRGCAVATITLETPFSDIEQMAGQLERRIAALRAETGAARVSLVTHSMGGLVARAYFRRFGGEHVARFVTIGGPHQGTVLARLGLGRSARQMEPGNAWLAGLNGGGAPPVPTLAIWTTGDEIVAPQDSARLPHVRDCVLPALGHLALGLSPQVAELVLADLAR